MDPLVQAAGGAGRGGGQEGVVNGPVGELFGEQHAVGAHRRLDANKEGVSRFVPAAAPLVLSCHNSGPCAYEGCRV